MSDQAAAPEEMTNRQISRMADEILDHRATLMRIRNLATIDVEKGTSMLCLGLTLDQIKREAGAALAKGRR